MTTCGNGNSDDPTRTIADYTKAINLNPDDAEAYKNRGNAYYDSGDLEQAIIDYEHYLELTSNASDQEVILNTIEQIKEEIGR